MLETNLENKVALVTGGNSGIGEAIVRKLASLKVKVVINYLVNDEYAETMVQEITNAGGEALAYKADIADTNQVEAMYKAIDQHFGGLDILFANAGIDGQYGLAWEDSLENWQRIIDINLTGNYCTARQALIRMIAKKSGVIIFTSSVHEEIAWTGHSAYTASKAAISMLTKTLGQEAAPYNVRVLAIAPGAIKTAINQDVWNNQAGLEDLLAKIPLGRVGEADEIAKMAAVLASDLASYITGRTIFIDGGMTDYPEFAHGG